MLNFRLHSIQFFFSWDFFLLLANIDTASYADDNTPYTMNKSTCEVLRDIKTAFKKLFKCLQNNSLEANPDKY